MPGIDFQRVREAVPMSRVLELIHYQPVRCQGDQLRGPCPIHKSTSPRSRSFSVDLRDNRFQYFKPDCQAKGNQLDLWAKLHGKTLFDAAKDLCERCGVDVPWIQRW